jgi:hypothetical protein
VKMAITAPPVPPFVKLAQLASSVLVMLDRVKGVEVASTAPPVPPFAKPAQLASLVRVTWRRARGVLQAILVLLELAHARDVLLVTLVGPTLPPVLAVEVASTAGPMQRLV